MMSATFTKSLKCPLTQDEKDQAGIRIARIQVEIEEKKNAIKEVSAGLKLDVKNLEAESRKLGRSLLDGAQERDVRCEERLDETDKRVNTHRLDTDAVVDSRPATMEELQGNLFSVPAVPGTKDEEDPGEKVRIAEAELRGDTAEADRIRAEAKTRQEAPLSDAEKAEDAAASAKANVGTGTDGDGIPVIGKRERKKKAKKE